MRFLIPLLMVFAAGGAAQAPAVAKIQGLFTRLQTAQHHKAAGKADHFQVQVSDSEINEYMRHALRVTPRPGLNSVNVKLFPYNYVSTYTVVDFDAVERWKPGTVPMLLRPVLNGKKAIWVDCRFKAENGLATFSVEKAYFQSIRLPAFFVEKMIEVVAARQPERYDTSKPLPLPFGVRRVVTGSHTALIAN